MVKAGYKQTEIGEIPVDWEVKTVIEFSSITTGDKNTQDRVEDGVYPFFVRSQNVESINSYSFDGEAVLTAGDGVGTGRIFHYINGKFDYHQRVYNIHNFSPEVDGFYFYNFFSSYFYDRIMSMTAKSSVDSVRREMISDMKIALPDRTEQEAISRALFDIDELIICLEKLIAKKRYIKTATMQQLLTGRKRLPGFGKEKGYKKSELGEIPEDWEISSLGDVCSFENGDRSSNYPSANEYADYGIPFINAGHVSGGVIDLEEMDYVPLHVYERLGGGKVRSGDLVYCLRGSLGKFGVVSNDFGLGVIASSLVIVRPKKEKTSTPYLSEYFKSEISRNMISLWAGGAAQPNLGAKELANFLIPLPAKDEQVAIANVLFDIDSEIISAESKLQKTKALKQGMMQELLTGRTRLVDVPVEMKEERMHGT
ncbi:MAG: restriction endonuclease subunit S [Saccharospirillum sp.]|uniref:restriction endonuclease subunit S n=1 Tax=Saccharospirillum sp. TaxID=2033801 RepID=UPI003296CC12